MTHHDLDGAPHHLWTTTHEPRLEVVSGDTIAFATEDAVNGRYDEVATGGAMPASDPTRPSYPLAGPILVAGAQPGDVLEVEILEAAGTKGFGWTSMVPDEGLLAGDFDESYLYRWEIDGDHTDMGDVARVPVRPFFGVVGVCPDTVDPLPVMPPGHFGGNLDCRDLVVGSSVFLPVQVPGARLALGDPHAAQGDGEVCVSAIEWAAQGAVRVRLHQGRRIPGPQFRTPGPLRAGIDDAGYYATTGIAPSLMDAAKDAVRAMIDHLNHTYGLDPRDAYVLCSVAVDLKISEVVDAPNWVVSAYLPLSIMR
ncbi:MULTISPECIES: acetamidase/formamidase family protein [Mumia]|uniref:acetamidase/formamidase family protein n=1 Tax=Mumia TaxID=1546255 RepID=UPI001421E89D|nr:MULTISPECIES: acetamidase/formamidase family protein [unclassified Mumia]QMW66770.1 acetamidase/formamidase family protein [Mumia sp. ZJ1417]